MSIDCQILTLDRPLRGKRDVVEVYLVWRRTRKQLLEAMRRSRKVAYSRIVRGGKQPPLGLCSIFERHRTDDGWMQKFYVYVSGTGRKCLNTLAHELGHVAHTARPADESRSDLLGCLIEGALPYFCARWRGSRLTELFESARVAQSSKNCRQRKRKGTP